MTLKQIEWMLSILNNVAEDLEDETGDDYDIGPHSTLADLLSVIRHLKVEVRDENS